MEWGCYISSIEAAYLGEITNGSHENVHVYVRFPWKCDMCLLIIGTYQLPVKLLQEAPDFLCVWEVKVWYVEYLYEMMRSTRRPWRAYVSPFGHRIRC